MMTSILYVLLIVCILVYMQIRIWRMEDHAHEIKFNNYTPRFLEE